MHSFRWIPRGLSVCLLFATAQIASAQQKQPLELIPADTVILLQSDGNLAHQAAWEKTAAFEAFRKSGLMDAFVKTVREAVSQVPDEKAGAALEILEFLAEHGLTVSIGLPPGNRPAVPYLTVVAHDAGPHQGVLDQFVDAAGDAVELKREDVSGRKVSRIMIPRTPGVELAWWSEGTHFVLTVGLGAVDSAMEVANGKFPNFAGTNTGKRLKEKLSFERTGFGWFNLAILRDRYGEVSIPLEGLDTVNQVLELVGLDGLNSVLLQSGYNGRSVWSTVDLDAPSPRQGILSLLTPSNQTMTMADLPPLPQNQLGFAAQCISLAATHDELLTIVKGVSAHLPPENQEVIENAIDQLPEVLGCDLRDDVLARLGPVMCVFTDANQGLLGAETGLCLQVKEAKKLRATVDQMLAKLQEQFPDAVKIQRREKHGQTLITVQVLNGVSNPTLLISDKWLCIGALPQTVESFALRLKGDLPAWKPDAETAEALAAGPGKFNAIGVAYPRHAIRLLVSIVPYLYQYGQIFMTQVRQHIESDIALSVTSIDIPPAEVVIKPLFPNITWGTVEDSGVRWTSRSSCPTLPAVGADGTTIIVAAIGVAVLVPALHKVHEAGLNAEATVRPQLVAPADERMKTRQIPKPAARTAPSLN